MLVSAARACLWHIALFRTCRPLACSFGMAEPVTQDSDIVLILNSIALQVANALASHHAPQVRLNAATGALHAAPPHYLQHDPGP